jgi:putative transposase
MHGFGLVRYSDRGVQYVSIKYTERAVGRSRRCFLRQRPRRNDQRPLQAEIIHRCGPSRSLETVKVATLEWIDWFNNRRLLEPIGNIPSADADDRWYAMLEQPATAASNKIAP